MWREETQSLVIGGWDLLHRVYPGPSEDDVEWAWVFDHIEDDENGDWSGRHWERDLTQRGGSRSIESHEDPPRQHSTDT